MLSSACKGTTTQPADVPPNQQADTLTVLDQAATTRLIFGLTFKAPIQN